MMREWLTVVTRKGQITVPVEIRKALGLHVGDKVALTLGRDEVRLKRVGSVAARTAGALKGREPVTSAEELRDGAEQVIAEDVVRRLNT